jgi:hypothetical protein
MIPDYFVQVHCRLRVRIPFSTYTCIQHEAEKNCGFSGVYGSAMALRHSLFVNGSTMRWLQHDARSIQEERRLIVKKVDTESV